MPVVRRLSAVLLALAPGVAVAGSISAPGVIAGPDSTAATPNPAAPHYNPAAMGGTEGVEILADAQVAFIRVDIDATRNDGIDPNTGQPYRTAEARVAVPVALLGLTWKVIPDRLAVGFSVSDTFVGGGDYTASEPDAEPPYEGHQRYAGITTKVVTLHMVPAAAVTVVDGVHVGAGLKVIYDSISALQAADPLGSEGVDPANPDAPYTADSYLQGSGTGTHLGWNAGLYVDRWRYARVGLSYTDNGNFTASGEGEVDAPDLVGGGNPPAQVSFDFPLPPVVQLWVNSDVTDQLTVGAGVEYQMWNVCCGDPDGDIAIGVRSEDGDPIGEDPEDGLTITVDPDQYSPRRLWNSANIAANAGYQLSDAVWLGGRVGFNQYAVPSYAVSATNLDFQNVGFQLAGRYSFGDALTVGLSYSKFFTQEREITDSAWNLQNGDPRFSPETPYKASANGIYRSKVDIVGVRIASSF